MDVKLEDLLASYLQCRSNKRNTKAALEFERDWESGLMELYRELYEDRYRLSPSYCFIVENPVKREVFAAAFRDRIVHHYVVSRLEPFWEKYFVFDCYSCRKGKGTLFGANRLKRFIAQCSEGYTAPCYVLQCDLQGFFMSIDRELLAERLDNFLGEYYTGEDLDTMRRLVRMIALANPLDGVEVRGNPRLWKDLPPDKSLFAVNGFPTPAQKRKGVQLDLFRCGKQIGLPIGNLTSQWFANFYLAPFDHYCKHTLGLRYYGRYVDDFFVVHSDPDYLKSLIPKFKEFLSCELKARLHPNKVKLTDYHKGISFIGVTIKGSTMLSGKRIKKNTCKALQAWNELAENRKLTDEEVERFTQIMNSYLGLMRHHNSYRLRVSLLDGMSSRLRKYFCINTPDKVISWDRVYYKAWLSVRNECYSRLHALRHKYPDKKFSFEELYNDICMERYLKRMGGV